MPFGPLHYPSLGLGLLQASLDSSSSRSLYLTFAMAEIIGVPLYTWLANGQPATTALLGEWLFRNDLFGSSGDGQDEAYLQEVVRQEGNRDGVTISEEDLTRILAAREKVSAFLARCTEEVLSHRPRLVAFTSVFQQQLASLALARRLKEKAPHLFTLMGGANCEGVMGQEVVRRFSFVDATVSGEGEKIFPRVVQRVLAGGAIDDLPGVATARGNRELPAPPQLQDHLDALPYARYEDFFAQFNASPAMSGRQAGVLFETSRGCWWGEKQHCTFCGLNGASMTYRSKSADRAMAELEHLAESYPARSVLVVDNILDMAYFKDFIPALARRNLDLDLFYEIKSNLTKEQLLALRQAGIEEIQPGIESFSDPTLALMRKGVTGLQNIQFLKWCVEIGILPYWNLIWGFPGEDPAEYRRQADLVPLLTHLDPPQGAMALRLDRYSPNFDQADRLGLTHVRPAPAYGYIYPFPESTTANLAYFFTHRYRDGRDVTTYTGPLQVAVNDWQQVHAASSLTYVDQGHRMLIWDLRPVARKRLWILDALSRAVYLECDGVQTIRSLARRIMQGPTPLTDSAQELQSHIDPLVDDGLLLREGDRLLALAVPQVAGRARRQAPPAA